MFPIIVAILNKRCRSIGVDPEGFSAQPLEKSRNVKIFISEGKTESVCNFRRSGITDRHLVSLSDLTVSVYIPVFDIACLIGSKVLLRGIGNFILIHKQMFGNVPPLLRYRIPFT